MEPASVTSTHARNGGVQHLGLCHRNDGAGGGGSSAPKARNSMGESRGGAVVSHLGPTKTRPPNGAFECTAPICGGWEHGHHLEPVLSPYHVPEGIEVRQSAFQNLYPELQDFGVV